MRPFRAASCRVQEPLESKRHTHKVQGSYLFIFFKVVNEHFTRPKHKDAISLLATPRQQQQKKSYMFSAEGKTSEGQK